MKRLWPEHFISGDVTGVSMLVAKINGVPLAPWGGVIKSIGIR